ncbi:MAG: porin family protein [Oceanicaulis sp.]
MAHMLKTAASALVLTAAAGAGAQAQWMDYDEAGLYLEGGYAYFNTEPENTEDGLDASGIVLRGGYAFSEMFSIEADVSTGLEDGDFDFNVDEDEFNFDGNNDGDLADVVAVAGDIGLNYLVGGYGKVDLPVTENIDIYGRAGYAYVDLDATIASAAGQEFNVEESADGPAFGAGGEVQLTESWKARLDYTYYSFEEADTDQFTVTLGYRF